MNTRVYNEIVHIKPKIVKQEFLQRKVDVKESLYDRAKRVKAEFYARHKAKKQEILYDKPQRVKNEFFNNAIEAKNAYWNNVYRIIKNQKKIVFKPNYKLMFLLKYYYKKFEFFNKYKD